MKVQIPIDDYCNHAMKLIGWDTDPKTGEQFWILVNSWGPKWAMNGKMDNDRIRPCLPRYNAYPTGAQ